MFYDFFILVHCTQQIYEIYIPFFLLMGKVVHNIFVYIERVLINAFAMATDNFILIVIVTSHV